MEYGIRLSQPGRLPGEPRGFCPEHFRDLLPEGPLRAVYFGSEFCQDLLPELQEAEAFCALAAEAGLEPVLLTPLVRANGLSRVEHLVAALAGRGWTPTVVFNDFGVLRMLRCRYPETKRQAGRLLNRALRDPRLADSATEPRAEDSSRGGKLRGLLLRYGVAGLETDPDLEGGYLGGREPGLQRVLHLPYVFAASGRNCLFKADAQEESRNFASGLGRECRGGCRHREQPVARPDLGFPLWRAGNTLFYEATRGSVAAHLVKADRIVVHERPMP